MSTKRICCGAAAIGSKLIVVGGMGLDDILDSALCVDLGDSDPTNMAVRELKTYLNERGVSIVGVTEKCELVALAQGAKAKAKAWSVLPSMVTKRLGCGVAVIGSKLIVVGGDSGMGELDSAECFDLETQSWSLLPKMSTKRVGCGVTAIGSKVIVVGGSTGADEALDSVVCFDLETQIWSPLPNMGTKRVGCGVAAIGSKLIVVGGSAGAGQALDSAECYDLEKQIWSPLPNMSTKRGSFGMGAIGSKLIAVGGAAAEGAALDSAEVLALSVDEVQARNPCAVTIHGPA